MLQYSIKKYAMIEFYQHSGLYTLELKQLLPLDLEDAWDFFSNPQNLSKITPSHMGFNITSRTSNQMFAGQIITYKIGVFPGVKSNWVTEITQVVENRFFIDEQRFGPYKMWHHEHHFEKTNNGVLMTDRVSYKIPLGFLGRIAHILFIKNKLKQIFSFRYNILNELFTDNNEMAIQNIA